MTNPKTTPELIRIQPNVRVEATAEVGSGLVVRWKLTNDGDRAVFVYDRGAWGAAQSKRTDDPEAPYRFVRDGRLRLLWGDCPLPRASFVTTHWVPAATRVEPGGTLERVARLTAPIVEHSVYWSVTAFKKRPPEAQRGEPIRSGGVDLLFDCLVDQPGLVWRPSLLAGAFEFDRALVTLQHAVRIHHALRTPEFGVLRRGEIDARPTLPGEAPEFAGATGEVAT